jgi:hypothetical protein
VPIRAHPNAAARFLSYATLPREPVSEAVPRSIHPFAAFCSMQLIKEAEKAFNVGPKSDDDGDDAE